MDDRAVEWAGRIAVLEHKVEQVSKELGSIEGKLDELLDLRNKGMGAFWVGSSLFGVALLALGTMIKGWFGG